MTLLKGLACMVVITSRMIVAMEGDVVGEETILLNELCKGPSKSVEPTNPLLTEPKDGNIKFLELQNIRLAVRVPPISDSDLERIPLDLLFQQKSAVPLVTSVILTPNQIPQGSFPTSKQVTFRLDNEILALNIREIPRDNQN